MIDQVHGLRRVGRYSILILMAAIVLFPIYVMVVGAFKPANKLLVDPLLPTNLIFSNFGDAWRFGHLGRALWNSLVVSVLITVAQVVTSVLAAYAFVFLRFPLKSLAFGLFLGTLLVPLEATMTVNRRTMENLDWINSYKGLTVPFLATAFGIFLIRQVFLQIPKEMREAAQMDGLGHFGFMREVAVPLSRPTIGALALFAFLSSWNQYLWPVLITTDEKYNTVQTGLKALKQGGFSQPNVLIAGTIIIALPIFIVLISFQRQLVRGLTAGAVKG
ncbi:MAG: carbohydrate ABC transporter permease [Ilumatobacteraceae bacterium]